ncbi:MAG: peptidylprolyl isomerase [Melioribacteraceae bacterium]|nr:peptidylprolyl isomerase [Melioribacteraceae bacterium]
MKKIILFLLLAANPIFSQYSSDDHELVKYTFQRDYSNKIFGEYFLSNSPEQVKALLLSVSHSEDTLFVKKITKLDFNKYGDYIAFALGQLGECKTSTGYLLNKLFMEQNLTYEKECFEALGKTGDQSTLSQIINLYYDKKKNKFEGISYAIVNFFVRDIKDEGSYHILKDELENYYSTATRKFEALFALYRIGPNESFVPALNSILNQDNSKLNIRLKNYALGCLQKLKTVPARKTTTQSLLNNDSWIIRCQAAKSLIYSKFSSIDNVKEYLLGINDQNPNVSRQFAISLKNIEVEKKINSEVISEIKKYLQLYSLTINTRGELFKTLCFLDSVNTFKYISEFGNDIGSEFIIAASANNLTQPEQNLELLLNFKNTCSNKELLELLFSSLSLQKPLRDNNKLTQFLLSELGSDFPAGVSIIADGINSVFISKNQNEIKTIINTQIDKYLNNSEFMESLMSLGNLSKKVDDHFYKEALLKLSKSELFSIQKYCALKQKTEFKNTKPSNNFEELWTNAFTYAGAVVNTNKGSFVIKFNPLVSPISVGNFCSLVLNGHYNNVIFHRVVPNFVIQTGDKSGTGWGGPGYEIVSEFSPEPFNKGFVGMASAGKDTEGSQWFVMHSDFPHLNHRYSNFGRIADGKNIVDIIDQDDIIISVELIK